MRCRSTGVAPDGGIDGEGFLRERRPRQAPGIRARRRAFDHLGQRAMRHVMFRHQHQAGGVLVQPVYDARAQFAADAGEVVHVIQQRLTSVPVQLPAPGCTTKPAGLLITSKSAS